MHNLHSGTNPALGTRSGGHLKTIPSRATRKSRKSENGILSARPCRSVRPIGRGLHKLDTGGARDGIFYVPDACRPGTSAPLILALHGAGGNAHDAIQPLRREADERGVLLVAPDSRAVSWDAMKNGFGPDVDFIDLALLEAFERCAVDPAHIAISGFSDGASYALSLGLANSDLFTHVIAFSPGFIRGAPGRQKPRIYVSHGLNDLVFPPVRCARRVVSRLKSDGYDVQFQEFAGTHAVPQEISSAAVDWFLRRPP
ncbi:MAG: phospholipase [Gemmatimonadota bacterium]|nr:phospholipase [Gemmatimonadota bacterium]